MHETDLCPSRWRSGAHFHHRRMCSGARFHPGTVSRPCAYARANNACIDIASTARNGKLDRSTAYTRELDLQVRSQWRHSPVWRKHFGNTLFNRLRSLRESSHSHSCRSAAGPSVHDNSYRNHRSHPGSSCFSQRPVDHCGQPFRARFLARRNGNHAWAIRCGSPRLTHNLSAAMGRSVTSNRRMPVTGFGQQLSRRSNTIAQKAQEVSGVRNDNSDVGKLFFKGCFNLLKDSNISTRSAAKRGLVPRNGVLWL